MNLKFKESTFLDLAAKVPNLKEGKSFERWCKDVSAANARKEINDRQVKELHKLWYRRRDVIMGYVR